MPVPDVLHRYKRMPMGRPDRLHSEETGMTAEEMDLFADADAAAYRTEPRANKRQILEPEPFVERDPMCCRCALKPGQASGTRQPKAALCDFTRDNKG